MHRIEQPKAEEKQEAVPEANAERLLFTTKTCPNCKIVKDMMNKRGIGYEIVDAEENAELCDKFGVMQAPTLVITNGESYEKYANASNIIRYLNSN